jgi:HTH-type transcriptional regulator / antitoxin HigA
MRSYAGMNPPLIGERHFRRLMSGSSARIRNTMKSMRRRSNGSAPVLRPRVIKTEAKYRATLARIESIFDSKPGTPGGDELELLLLLIETYEDQVYLIDLPDPIAALKFRMGQDDLRPKDLAPFIGSKSRVSEVLSGRRPLSLSMIRKLVAGLDIPAEVALQAGTPRMSKSQTKRRAVSRTAH